MAKLFAFDTETFLIQPGLAAPDIVCGSWADADGEWIGDPEETRAFFVSALKRGDHLVGVNLAYDIVVMAARWPALLPLIFAAGDAGQLHDCSIREALHDIAIDKLFIDYKTGASFGKSELGGRYSMAVLMDRHFGVDISAEKTGDVWRYKYGTLAGIPIAQWPAAAVEYPKQDARRTYDICKKQSGHKNRHDAPAQVRASIAIQFMVTWGLRTDAEYLAHLEREVDELWNTARVEFAKAGIFRENGTKDMTALRGMVNTAYNGNPPKTAKGEVSTDRDTLEESGVDVLVKLGTSGKNDKRKTQYIPALKRGTVVPINPQFNVLVGTGRVSSDWQQMPQKGGIREAVVSRGHLERLTTKREPQRDTVIVSCDYAGLELRTMAQRAINDPDIRFSKMADYLNSGKDAHSYVGGFFLGITLEEFLARAAELKPYRDVAKMFNFGAGGGAGAGAIAYNAKVKEKIHLCLTLKRATKCGEVKQDVRVMGKVKRVCALCITIAGQLKEMWLRAWPEQGLLFEKASRLTARSTKVDSITFGSKRVRGGCGYTQWLNGPFQGAGGDGCKAAMWNVARSMYCDPASPLWNSRTCLNVHDELLAELPFERRHEAAFEVARVMVDTMNAITPDVKNEVVPAIMRRVFKSAKDVYDRAGVLKPYWPADWKWAPDAEVMARDLAA